MRTRKIVVSKIRERGLQIVPAAVLAAMLVLGGCSSQNADQPTEKPMAVNFQLEKCQQIEPNLYKCPAVDQAMCTPEFQRTDVNCIRIGPKGSVFVQRGGIMP
jgi:PBP1b-binding outer membrane lipoprotein LpoB